jgi:hypothetical protein
MARRARRAKQSDAMAQATVQAAEINSRGVVEAARVGRSGTLHAAKLNSAGVVLAAVVAGTCGVTGVGIQGHYATRQAQIEASEKVLDLPRSWTRMSPLEAREALIADFALQERVLEYRAGCSSFPAGDRGSVRQPELLTGVNGLRVLVGCPPIEQTPVVTLLEEFIKQPDI